MNAPITFDRPSCNAMVSVAGVTVCMQGRVQVRERVAPYKFLMVLELPNLPLVCRTLTGSDLEVSRTPRTSQPGHAALTMRRPLPAAAFAIRGGWSCQGRGHSQADE